MHSDDPTDKPLSKTYFPNFNIDLTELFAIATRLGAINEIIRQAEKPIPPQGRDGIVVEDGTGKRVDVKKGDLGRIVDTNGHNLAVYIDDQGWAKPESTLSQKKVHFMFECSTLNKMKNDGRYNRYISVYDNDLIHPDGPSVYDINGKRAPHKMQANYLKVKWSTGTHSAYLNHHLCKNCLNSWLSASGQNKQSLNETSLIIDILATYKGKSPTKQDPSIPRNPDHSGYSDDWDSISQRIRQSHHWCCDECKINLSEHQYLLDCHHIDGVKSHNTTANLRPLCKTCHKKQPNHGHLSINLDDRHKLDNLRRAQRKAAHPAHTA
jgi:hypothetical protein